MLPNSKVPLRASQRKKQQRLRLRRQARLRSAILLSVIVFAWLADLSYFHSHLLITKSVAIGAFLNWFAQSLFAWLVFRYTEARARQAIVGHLYLGQIIKWIIVIVGFALIFSLIKPLSAPAVIFGFIFLQLAQILVLWQMRK